MKMHGIKYYYFFLIAVLYLTVVAEGIGDKYTYRYGPTAAVIDDAESSVKCPENFFGTTCQCAVNQNCDGSYFTNDTCRAFTKGLATTGVQAKITCVPNEPYAYMSYFNVLKKLWYSDPNPVTDISHRLSIECPIGSTMTGCSLYSPWMPSFANGVQDCAIKSGLCTSSVYCPSHRCSIQARCRKEAPTDTDTIRCNCGLFAEEDSDNSMAITNIVSFVYGKKYVWTTTDVGKTYTEVNTSSSLLPKSVSDHYRCYRDCRNYVDTRFNKGLFTVVDFNAAGAIKTLGDILCNKMAPLKNEKLQVEARAFFNNDTDRFLAYTFRDDLCCLRDDGENVKTRQVDCKEKFNIVG